MLHKQSILNIDLIEEKSEELKELRKKYLEGKLIRSRAKWINERDKPSNYFCNLENRNFVSKTMNKLYSRNGTLLHNKEEILTEAMNHFKSLYSKKPVKTSILIHCLKTPIFLNFLMTKNIV